MTEPAGLAPRAFVERPPRPTGAHGGRRAWIDLSRALCTLTWRALIRSTTPGRPGASSSACRARAPYGWADVEALLARAGASPRREGRRARTTGQDLTTTAQPAVANAADTMVPAVHCGVPASALPFSPPRPEPAAATLPRCRGLRPYKPPRVGDATLDVPRVMIAPAAPAWSRHPRAAAAARSAAARARKPAAARPAGHLTPTRHPTPGPLGSGAADPSASTPAPPPPCRRLLCRHLRAAAPGAAAASVDRFSLGGRHVRAARPSRRSLRSHGR